MSANKNGIGTAAGDPLETEAVGRVFASTRKPGQPLYIGSVKTNIGHLEGGAGLAGLIKSLFILERGQIPPNLWFETLNPKIDLEGWGLAVSLLPLFPLLTQWVSLSEPLDPN
jgi:acyl transferase domain-containing protein